MLPANAGRDESTYIGYAVVTALLDLLIERNIISETDVSEIFSVAVKSLRDHHAMIPDRAADLLAGWVPGKK